MKKKGGKNPDVKISTLIDFLRTLYKYNTMNSLEKEQYKGITASYLSVKTESMTTVSTLIIAKKLYLCGCVDIKKMGRGSLLFITDKGIEFLRMVEAFHEADPTTVNFVERKKRIWLGE